MRTWKFENCTVKEIEFDQDLHEFEVVVKEEIIATITPGSLEEMESIVKDLEAGGEPNGWEDGKGNTISY